MNRKEHLLTDMAKKLLVSSGLTNAGFATSNIFVSLFFYIASGSIEKMALYGIGQYVGLILVSLALVKFARQSSPRALFKFGILLTALFYIGLILLGHKVTNLALPLGLFNGIAIGIYWFGNNTLAYDLVEPEERNHFYGINFSVMSALNVVMPFLAGELVTHISGSNGFKTVFAMAFILFGVAFYSSKRLGMTTGMGDVSIWKSFILPLEKPNWMRMWLSVALRSMNQIAQSLGIIVMVVLATHNSADQGIVASIISIASAVTSILVGRINPKWRTMTMRLGAMGVILATSLLLISHDFYMILAFGILNGLTYPSLFVPLSTVALDVMDDDLNVEETRGGYVLSRELSTNIGRLLGVGLLLVFLHFLSPFTAVFTAMAIGALSQLIVVELTVKVITLRSGKLDNVKVPEEHDESILDTAAHVIIRPVGP